MCGIAGIAGRTPDLELLKRMGSVLRHRGPNYGDELVEHGLGLAFRRLSIIDVEGGHQPIFNEDRSVALMLNGEIYNHRELRAGLEHRGHQFATRSDVEVVLHLWEDMNVECLQPLRGMFALAIWDRNSRTLFLARDRVGKKPLYYHQLKDGALLFGSEIKAILQHPELEPSPDLKAIDQFLTLGYVPSGKSAFTGVQRLHPAHWLRWQAGGLEVRRYWSLDFTEKSSATRAEIHEEVGRLVREAVTIRLESEVPLGAFLSGGVDSSAVVAFAAQAMTQPLNTFSIGFEAQGFDESCYARQVAQRFQTNHHELVLGGAGTELVDQIVWHHDQPFGDSSAIPTFQLASLTRPHVTVVLTGDGGDESFAGYRRYQMAKFGRYFALPSSIRALIAAGFGLVSHSTGRGRRLIPLLSHDEIDAYFLVLAHLAPGRKDELYTDELLTQVAGSTYEALEVMRGRRHPSSLDAFQDADVNSYLPDDLLVKMDVATMAHSLEARCPLLDHELMEFLARVPASLKVAGGQPKHLLKSVLADLLPPQLLHRRKMGFGVPLGHWLRTSLREQLTDTLLAEHALQRGYFRRGSVERMMRALMSGDDMYQYQLWDLLMLELWHRVYLDAVSHSSPSTPISADLNVTTAIATTEEILSNPPEPTSVNRGQ